MDGKSLILIVLIAFSYYFFSDQFFKFTAEIKNEKVSRLSHFICFLLVYQWFVIASYTELPLIVNWFVFLIILGLEIRIVFSFDLLISYGLSLFCVITSLAVNIFFRSAASILLKIPLTAFDNLKSPLKSYPIFLGFLVMALLFFVLRRNRFSSQLERLLRYRKSLVFYTWTEFFIYLFLMVQLLAFSQSGNETGVKTWGIKAALFSVIVLIITIIYSLRVASLQYYMDKQHDSRSQLIREKQDINKLWKLAYTDMLTGLNNRQLLEKRLEEYAGYGSIITLAFADVNGLKITNDQYGHLEGDSYLIHVSRILSELCEGLNIDLFRYGGDEFVLMSNSLGEEEITDLLQQANDRLKGGPAQYPQSVSYGVVQGDSAAYQSLLTAADEKMYKYKLTHYEKMARSQ